MDLAELSTALREYAGTEHGKRSKLHTEIMRGVIANPSQLASEISEMIRKAALYTVMKMPPDERAKLLAMLDSD